MNKEITKLNGGRAEVPLCPNQKGGAATPPYRWNDLVGQSCRFADLGGAATPPTIQEAGHD
jgi:hypothetical protein